MFDIRKIQEQAIWEAVKRKSSEETAEEIVYGTDGTAADQDPAAWVNGTMHRLEAKFSTADVKQIRMSCQCGRKAGAGKRIGCIFFQYGGICRI